MLKWGTMCQSQQYGFLDRSLVLRGRHDPKRVSIVCDVTITVHELQFPLARWISVPEDPQSFEDPQKTTTQASVH